MADRNGGGRLYALGEVAPRIAASAFLAPGSVAIGDVEMADESSLWFNVVVRGDVAPVRIGARSNVQDGSVIHADPGFPAIIGEDVLIGHKAIVHGATIHDRGFVGMGATVLNGAVIESDGMLAAGALLTGGKTIASGELWAGAPAKFVRKLDEKKIAEMRQGAARYVANARRYLGELREVT
jgi:gamma-carbonic anhydrase